MEQQTDLTRPTVEPAPSISPAKIVAAIPHIDTALALLGAQQADTDDLVQDVVCWAIANIDKYDPTRPNASIEGWLVVIARNAIKAYKRHKRRFLPTMDLEPEGSLQTSIEALVLLGEGIRAIKQYRRLFIQHYLQNQAVEDLAQMYELSERQVRSRLECAEEQFKAALDDKRAEQQRSGIFLPFGIVALLDLARRSGAGIADPMDPDAYGASAIPSTGHQPCKSPQRSWSIWKDPLLVASGAAVGLAAGLFLGSTSCTKAAPAPTSPSVVVAAYNENADDSATQATSTLASSDLPLPAQKNPPRFFDPSPEKLPKQGVAKSVPRSVHERTGDDTTAKAIDLLDKADTALFEGATDKAVDAVKEFDAKYPGKLPALRESIRRRLGH